MIRQWLARQKVKKEAEQKQKDYNRLQWCVSRCNALNTILAACKENIPAKWVEEYANVQTERDHLAQKLGYKIVTKKD